MSDRAVPPSVGSRLCRVAMRDASRGAVRHGWTQRDLLVCFAAAAIGLGVTRDAWIGLFEGGDPRAFGLPLLVIPAAMWLAWIRRGRLRVIRPPMPTLLGPLLMALGWHVHAVVGAGVSWAEGLGSLMVTIGCVLSVAGPHVLRQFLPAFAVLVFLVPLPDAFREALFPAVADATSGAISAVLGAFGGDVARSGDVVSVGDTAVTVGHFSGGLNVIGGLTVVGFAFAFGARLRLFMRFVFLAATPVLALGLNVLRMSLVTWLHGVLPDTAAAVADAVSGWLSLPLAVLVLLGLVRLLRQARLPVTRFNLAYGT